VQFLASLSGKTNKTTNGGKSNSRYRCVEVQTHRDDCCKAAHDLAGKRFLHGEVPALPLDECDAGECGCDYKLLDDRRSGPRRASDVASDMAKRYVESDDRRPRTSGRRWDD
jgi:hypothetical protein